MHDKYFAKMDADDLAQELDSRFSDWKDFTGSSGLEKRWSKSFRYYYGAQVNGAREADFSASNIFDGGEDGELKVFGINHFRNLIRHIMSLTTAQRPVFDCRAINTDFKSMQVTKLANQILDYYMRDKKVVEKCEEAAEQSLVLGKGWVSLNWDKNKGDAIGVEPILDESGEPMLDDEGETQERIIYEGDIRAQVHSVMDVRIDEGAEDWDDCDWYDVRVFEPRWDLVAKYPKHKDEIKAHSDVEVHGRNNQSTFRNLNDKSDFIAVYKFYHRPSPSLPSGRVQFRLKDGPVLYDGPYPYGDRLNIFPIAGGEIFGTTIGYTDMFDALVVQEVINTLESTQFTNQEAFGVQSVAVVETSNIDTESINGMNFIKIKDPSHMPQAVQLTRTPPEIANNIQSKIKDMEKISGINSVVRGDPDHQLKSGAALARVQAMAIQFNSSFQKAWAGLLENVSEFQLHLLKEFAVEERLIAVSGKKHKGAMKRFKGEDLKVVETVQVDLGNPLSRTYAGRLEIADRLLDKGMIQTPQQYLEVQETGNLDALTDGETAQLELIRKENEDLMDGKPVQAVVGDKHLLHMQEHITILADPELRRAIAVGDQAAMAVMDSVQAHIEEHKQLYASQDVIWSAISGEPPSPKPPAPAPPMGPPNAQGQGSEGGPQPPPPPVGAQPSPVEQAENPMPNAAPMPLPQP